MPPTPARLHELLLAAGFTAAQLDSITQSAFGTGLSAITPSADSAEQAAAVIRFAERYGLIRDLTAMVLANGSGKPALQNLLLDDNMSLEDGRVQQSTAIDLVRLENKVERLTDVVGTLNHTVQVQGQRIDEGIGKLDAAAAAADKRIYAIEYAAARISPSDKLTGVIVLLAMLSMLAIYLWSISH